MVCLETIPTHPAVVHVPLALSALIPLASAFLVWAIRRGRARESAWGWVVGGHLLLVLSAGVASLAGDADARRIQTRVEADVIEHHADAGYRFLIGAAVCLVVALTGAFLQQPKRRAAARVATLVVAVATAGLGVIAGHDGAVLVYREGAAAAWTEVATPP